MQGLEVSGAVRPLESSLDVKGLRCFKALFRSIGFSVDFMFVINGSNIPP